MTKDDALTPAQEILHKYLTDAAVADLAGCTPDVQREVIAHNAPFYSSLAVSMDLESRRVLARGIAPDALKRAFVEAHSANSAEAFQRYLDVVAAEAFQTTS